MSLVQTNRLRSSQRYLDTNRYEARLAAKRESMERHRRRYRTQVEARRRSVTGGKPTNLPTMLLGEMRRPMRLFDMLSELVNRIITILIRNAVVEAIRFAIKGVEHLLARFDFWVDGQRWLRDLRSRHRRQALAAFVDRYVV